MISTPATVAVPLRTDESGVIRVGQTRITLVTLLSFYNQGQSPEALHAGFPTVPLGDIYAVIAYYLAHQDELDQYLAEEKAADEHWRQDYEANTPQAALSNAKFRALLEARHAKGQS